MRPQNAYKSIEACAQGQAECSVRELDELDYRQALALLAEHPLEGVHLESLINDHGLTSPTLRGRFFGYFEQDRLTGIALLGHQIMFCAPDAALPHLARTAATSGLRNAVIFGPSQQVELFWQYYGAEGRTLKMQRQRRTGHRSSRTTNWLAGPRCLWKN